MKVNHNITSAKRRVIRVRKKLRGTTERPRLCVVRTNQHIYAQVIDDTKGITIVSASDVEKSIRDKTKEMTKTERSEFIAQQIYTKLQKANVQSIVFDRGKSRYHGRVKMIADTLRTLGVQF